MSRPMGPRGHRGGGTGFGPRGIGRPVDKAKDFKGTLKRLTGYLKPHKWSLLAVLMATILSSVVAVFSPKIMGQATTLLFEGMLARFGGSSVGVNFPALANILAWLFATYLFSTVFGYVQQIVMVRVAQRTVFKMREDVSEKLARLPLKYYDRTSHGDTLSRVTNDVDLVSQSLQQSIVQLISSLVSIVGVTVMMLTISPLMTLLTIVMLPVSGWLSALIAIRSQKLFVKQQRVLGELNGQVEESYTGHSIVKAYGLEGEVIGSFSKLNDELYETGWKAQFVSGIIMPLTRFVGNLGYVVIAVVGGVI